MTNNQVFQFPISLFQYSLHSGKPVRKVGNVDVSLQNFFDAEAQRRLLPPHSRGF
jgi:hypothetical protein